MPADRVWLDAGFERAQADALKKRLPLAAVTCIPADIYTERLPMLQKLESTLEPYSVPLITLIGTEAATLPSLVKHARPVHVYGHKAEGEMVKIVSHPYKWPGIVIKTDELKKIVDKNEYMC